MAAQSPGKRATVWPFIALAAVAVTAVGMRGFANVEASDNGPEQVPLHEIQRAEGDATGRELALAMLRDLLPSAEDLGLAGAESREETWPVTTGVQGRRYFRLGPIKGAPGLLRRHVEVRVGVTVDRALETHLRRFVVHVPSQIPTLERPRGAATGDPIGAEFVGARLLPNTGYGVSAIDYSGFACSAGVKCWVDSEHPRQGSASPAEVWLAEQAVRKIIANLHGIRFSAGPGPPRTWIAVPRRLSLDGRPLDLPPLTERVFRNRYEPRSHPVPKPAEIDRTALVAYPYLEAMGLAVEFGRWASWGLDRWPGFRPLDRIDLMATREVDNIDFTAWLAAPKDITLARGGQRLTFLLEATEATAADGTVISLPAPARLLDGWPVVPLEPVAAYFGLDVEVLPGADWSGDAFAAWLDQVSPENPPLRGPRVEPPPPPVDEALLARIKEALIGREALAENLRLGYLAEYEFDEKYAASLRGRKLPPEVETTWRLHFEWAFTSDGRRVDVGPADEPLPWREWRDARGEQRAPGPIPGFVRDLWDEPAGPTPLLRGYGGHTWSDWFTAADRIELEATERDGRPHHRLKLRRREEPMATYLELWLPADALSTPAALRYQRLDTEIGRSAVREVEFDGWRAHLPTGLRETQRTEWGEPRRELPEQTVVYSKLATAAAADAAGGLSLSRPIEPLR